MTFDLSLISKYRAQLMGVAMLIIMFFHITLDVQLVEHTFLYTLKRQGNFGVDMFMFVSGLGIFYSWRYSIKSNILAFYKRRFVRIIPMYLIFITIYSAYIIYAHGSPLRVWLELASTSQFWTSDTTSFWKFWYIPAILFMYVISPIYLKITGNNFIKSFFIATSILLAIAIAGSLIDNHIMYSVLLPLRTVSFVMGITVGYLIEKKTVIKAPYTIMLIILGIGIFILHLYWQQDRWLSIPTTNDYIYSLKFWVPYTIVTPILCMLLCKLFALVKDYKYPILTFLGTYSLSIYLWHQPLMQGIDTMVSNAYLSNAISFAITMPVAYIFQKTVYYLTDKIIK